MRRPASRRRAATLVAVALSLLLHAFLVPAAVVVALHDVRLPRRGDDAPIEVVRMDRAERPRASVDDPPDDDPVQDDAPEEDEPEEPEPEQPEGQIVELPPDPNPERPEEADYLAETDHRVEKETRAPKFEINPEVLADRWSPEQRVELKGEDVVDLDQPEPATGATIGGVAAEFDATRDGMLAATSSKWKITNREGADAPVPSAAMESVLAGAPQNDRLLEQRGASTSLNTKEFLYASYIARIRRLVNFYWNQNIQALPNSTRLVRPEYTSRVKVVLDGSGALETIEVIGESGSPELDDAVVRAFKVAGPFANPPPGIVGADGRILLPEMAFTVTVGVAEMRFDGVDPRAGVQFPGILKAPR